MTRLAAPLIAALIAPFPVAANEIINNNLLVVGSGCFGPGCTSSELSVFTEMQLRDTSPSLWFDDTSSSSASNRDWRIQKNGNDLIVESVAKASFRFDIENRFGIGTNNPELNIHITAVDTPSIRMREIATPGGPETTWDIGANDANFFVRNFTFGQKIPFRIRPAAPNNAFVITQSGDIGFSTAQPDAALHINRNKARNEPHLLVETPSSSGRAEIWFADGNTEADNDALRLQLNGDAFNISFNGTGGAELQVTKSGDVRLFRGDLVIRNGGVIVGGQALNVPDYVFADDYQLMPLGDVADFIDAHAHLPHVPSSADVSAHGLDMVAMQLALLKTVEELTLHTLAQQREIEALKAALAVSSAFE